MAKTNPISGNSYLSGFSSATGPITFRLTNDLLFHKVMQHSNHALCDLVCALMGYQAKDIKSVILENPIDYGNFSSKYIYLDIKVLLNDNERINIEIMCYHDAYWNERSMLYLCRTFDALDIGEDYAELIPATQISIMTYDLFPEKPEFYARHQMMNIRTHKPYTSKFSLNVLSLNRTELATKQDKKNDLVFWAELFNADTWEKLRSLSTHSQAFKEVAEIMYTSHVMDEERVYLDAHQRFLDLQASQLKTVERMKEIVAEKDSALAEKDSALAEKDSTIAEKDSTIAEMNSEIERLKAQIQQMQNKK